MLYNSVLEMVEKESDSQEYIDLFKKRLEERKLIKKLMIIRVSRNISELDMANAMNCSINYLQDIENKMNEDLTLKEIYSYVKAIGYKVDISLKEI